MTGMKDMGALMQRKRAAAPKAKRAPSEWGELVQWFVDQVNRGRGDGRFSIMTFGRMAKKLEGLSVQDLYYMRSVMRDLELNPSMMNGKRLDGYSRAMKWMWWSLDPKKHQ